MYNTTPSLNSLLFSLNSNLASLCIALHDLCFLIASVISIGAGFRFLLWIRNPEANKVSKPIALLFSALIFAAVPLAMDVINSGKFNNFHH